MFLLVVSEGQHCQNIPERAAKNFLQVLTLALKCMQQHLLSYDNPSTSCRVKFAAWDTTNDL